MARVRGFPRSQEACLVEGRLKGAAFVPQWSLS